MEKRILLIDDDITALDIVSYLIEERGYKVDRYADGYAALEYLRDNVPDLIIVDLMMPDINGVDTVQQMRSLGVTAPIIAFTAVDEPDLHQEAVNAGCNKVITKPCRADKLMEHVKQLLAKQELDRAM